MTSNSPAYAAKNFDTSVFDLVNVDCFADIFEIAFMVFDFFAVICIALNFEANNKIMKI